MNTTKFYELFTDNKEYFDRAGDSRLTEFYNIAMGMINEEIAKEAEKAAGRKANVRNSVKKFLSKDPARPVLQVANVQTINGVKYYGYCDGFKLAWSPIDFGFGVAEEYNSLKWGNIVNVNFKNIGIIDITPELKAELCAHIKTHKKSDRAPFEIKGPDGYTILVNPDYFKACIDFTSATEMVVDLDNDHAPILFYGVEDRNALCLPIRK